MALNQSSNLFISMQNSLKLFCRLIVNIFSFSRAAILEHNTDQRLLYNHTTCRLNWRTRHAYKVSIIVNAKLYGHYAPRQIVQVPIDNIFNVQIIAHSIYGSTAKTLNIPVVCLKYREAKRPSLVRSQSGLPVMTQSLAVTSLVIVPNTPTPMFNPAVANVDFGTLRVIGAELEAEIIKQAYQTETNTHYYAD